MYTAQLMAEVRDCDQGINRENSADYNEKAGLFRPLTLIIKSKKE
jgi:hypothetical protein